MIYTLALLGLFLGFTAQDNPVKILDLTEAEMIYPNRDYIPIPSRVGIPAGFEGPRYSLPAMSLEIIFDKNSYIIGEEFTYEIRLKNISDTDIRIPLEPDGPRIDPDGEKMPREIGLVEIYSKLDIDENSEKIKADEKKFGNSMYGPIASFALYGSDKIDGSLVTLNPGESIVIRNKGKRGWAEDNIFSEEELKDKIIIHVSAVLNFNAGFYRTLKDVPYDYKVKSESIPIEIIIPPNEENKDTD